jgi:hypothetical protein
MAFINSRIERLLSRAMVGRGPATVGLDKFIALIPSGDVAAVRRFLAHLAARSKDSPAINVEAVDERIVAQTDRELQDDVAEIVRDARAWWVEHEAEVARSGGRCDVMGCFRR